MSDLSYKIFFFSKELFNIEDNVKKFEIYIFFKI